MTRKKTPRASAKTYEGCRFAKLGGYPCDLGYPERAVAKCSMTVSQAIAQLCEPCQQHLKETKR